MSPDNISSTLPPRFKESAFRFYEPFIATIIKRWPMVTTFNPQEYGKSNETFCARLRDAMTSLYRYNWPSTIDRRAFLDLHADITVSNRGSVVACGPADAIRAAFATTPTASVCDPKVEGPAVLDLSGLDYGLSEFEVIARLAHERALNRAIKLTINPLLVEKLLESYDVAIEQVGPNLYTLT